MGEVVCTDKEEHQWVCDIINGYIKNNEVEGGFDYNEVSYSDREKKVYFKNNEEKAIFLVRNNMLVFKRICAR